MSNAISKQKPEARSQKLEVIPTSNLQPPSSNFGSPLRVILFTLIIFFLSQIIAALAVELLSWLFLQPSATSSVLEYSSIAQFIFILLAEGLAVGAVLLILKKRGLSLAQIGWGRRLVWRDIWSAGAGFLIFYFILIVATLILTALIPSYNIEQAQDVGFNNLSTSTDRIIALAALVVLPPLGEELLIRGYLYSGLRSAMNFVPAMLATSVLFGAAHLLTGVDGLLWAAAVDTFVLSLVLVYLREKTGALYAGMILHALNNLVAFGVHFHS